MSQQKAQNFFNLVVAVLTIVANVGVVVWFAADIHVTVTHINQRVNKLEKRVDLIGREIMNQKAEIGEIKGILQQKDNNES